MTNRAQEAYINQRILSADPVDLVCMLYAGASEAVEMARARLKARDIRGRSSAITKALRILFELAGTLDHQRAPELSRNLAALYDYMQRRLIEANLRQEDPPLAEVLNLIQTLGEAWKGVSAVPVAEIPLAPAAGPAASPKLNPTLAAWNPAAHIGEPEPAHGWSF
jgi:flagellar secretion chaperone FliS